MSVGKIRAELIMAAMFGKSISFPYTQVYNIYISRIYNIYTSRYRGGGTHFDYRGVLILTTGGSQSEYRGYPF